MKKDDIKWFVIYGEVGGDSQTECFETEAEATHRAWIVLTDYTVKERTTHTVEVCKQCYIQGDNEWESSYEFIAFYFLVKDGEYNYPEVFRTYDDAKDFVNDLIETEEEHSCYKIADQYGETVWKHEKEVW